MTGASLSASFFPLLQYQNVLVLPPLRESHAQYIGLCIYRNRRFPLAHAQLTKDSTLKENRLPTSLCSQLAIASRFLVAGVRLMSPYWGLLWLECAQGCACCHAHCAFLCVAAMFQKTLFPYIHPLSLAIPVLFHLPHRLLSPEKGKSDTDITFRVKHSTAFYYLHLGLWVLLSIRCKQKLLQ